MKNRKVRLKSVEYTRDFYGYNDDMHGLHAEFYVYPSELVEKCWIDEYDDYYREEDLTFLD